MAEEGTIKVDIPALKDMAGRLAGLKEEFEHMGEMANHYHDAVGHHRVAEQLGNFATNWSDAREKLCQTLAQVAGYADSAAETYAAREQSITDATKGGAGG
jgi:hypothetical protein